MIEGSGKMKGTWTLFSVENEKVNCLAVPL